MRLAVEFVIKLLINRPNYSVANHSLLLLLLLPNLQLNTLNRSRFLCQAKA
jgi:hypothetical protein